MKKIFFILYVVLSSFFILTSSHAENLIEMANFKDWSVFKTQYQYDHNYCYALATPYKTRAFKGLRNLPYFIIRHFGQDNFTLSATPGFSMDILKGFILNANNRSHLFSNYSSHFSWTGSYIQDRAILQDILLSKDYFTIRSYNQHDETALDYYSTHGLKDALTFIKQNCK